jgi:type VI protein secretion system component VasK
VLRLLAAALLAALVLGAVQPTLALYSATAANTATASTQAVFPPLNSAPPTISQTLGGGAVTSLSANQSLSAAPGTWTTAHALTTTYGYQWQRCVGATCADIAGATLSTYVVQAADTAHRLRVRVTGTDSDPSVAPRKSTGALSAPVP